MSPVKTKVSGSFFNRRLIPQKFWFSATQEKKNIKIQGSSILFFSFVKLHLFPSAKSPVFNLLHQNCKFFQSIEFELFLVILFFPVYKTFCR